MQADWQPQIAAAKERISEQNSPKYRVADAERRSGWIRSVGEPEDYGGWEDRCKRTDLFNQKLEGVAAKNHFFASRGYPQDDQIERQARPVERGVLPGDNVRRAGDQRRNQHQRGRAAAERHA